jgi:hypothetical protein
MLTGGVIICSARDIENLKIDDIEPSIASEIVASDLPDDIFTKPLNLARGYYWIIRLFIVKLALKLASAAVLFSKLKWDVVE